MAWRSLERLSPKYCSSFYFVFVLPSCLLRSRGHIATILSVKDHRCTLPVCLSVYLCISLFYLNINRQCWKYLAVCDSIQATKYSIVKEHLFVDNIFSLCLMTQASNQIETISLCNIKNFKLVCKTRIQVALKNFSRTLKDKNSPTSLKLCF